MYGILHPTYTSSKLPTHTSSKLPCRFEALYQGSTVGKKSFRVKTEKKRLQFFFFGAFRQNGNLAADAARFPGKNGSQKKGSVFLVYFFSIFFKEK